MGKLSHEKVTDTSKATGLVRFDSRAQALGHDLILASWWLVEQRGPDKEGWQVQYIERTKDLHLGPDSTTY